MWNQKNMKVDKQIIKWLLEGDPSIRYQTLRDLTDAGAEEIDAERVKISQSGWGKKLLDLQGNNGIWGGGLYSPKWISTTYTLLLLKRLGIKSNPQIKKAVKLLLDKGYFFDHGINYFQSLPCGETCVTGLLLSLLVYFELEDKRINNIANHLLQKQLKDHGWNCLWFKGATHSSFHTTINVLEGLFEYEKIYTKGNGEIKNAQLKAMQFLLDHKLFRSHRTGKIVDPKMTRFAFPPRWRYDIMRILDYAQVKNLEKDDSFRDAIQLVQNKQTKEGYWRLQNRHPGKTFFELEKTGEISRWNTLRALRILKWWHNSQRIRH